MFRGAGKSKLQSLSFKRKIPAECLGPGNGFAGAGALVACFGPTSA